MRSLIVFLALALPACTPDIGPPDSDEPDETSPPTETDGPPDTGAEPTAVGSADPAAGTVPFAITLSAAGSSAGVEPIDSYTWTLPDGSELEGETVGATMVSPGAHDILLTVADASGRSDEATVPVEAGCPAFADATVAGTMAWGEVSGLAAGSVDGVLWAHSDAQGSGAEVYAISTDAILLGTFVLSGVNDYDFEDIARGPGPDDGVSYLYIGDTGDNSERRSSVTIYRFPEPQSFGGSMITGVESIELTYPDGPRDAETLIIDPVSGDLILVERDRADQGVTGIYVAEAPLNTSGPTELTKTGTVVFGTPPLVGDVDATGGDVSPDGTHVIVRSHDAIYLWARDPEQPLHTAFDAEPCATPLVDEYKGEALAWAHDGSGYYSGGEGSNQPLNYYAVE